jgi:hypothetical protein
MSASKTTTAFCNTTKSIYEILRTHHKNNTTENFLPVLLSISEKLLSPSNYARLLSNRLDLELMEQLACRLSQISVEEAAFRGYICPETEF